MLQVYQSLKIFPISIIFLLHFSASENTLIMEYWYMMSICLNYLLFTIFFRNSRSNHVFVIDILHFVDIKVADHSVQLIINLIELPERLQS